MEIDFPLYTTLKQESYKMKEIPDVWKYIINIPLEHLDILYALIWHHFTSEQTKQKSSNMSSHIIGKKIVIPYKGKLFDTGKGIIFHVKDIPLDLQKILSCYILGLVQNEITSVNT